MKQVTRNKKRNGGAVSLYLPSEVKHLHEMASADENMKPSKIYADALRAIFGDVEELHPIEHLAQTQIEEIEDLQVQIDALKDKHKKTSERIPIALATAFWDKNKVSDAEYRELRQLRSILWYKVEGTKEITVEITGDACLQRYKELIFRHFATANGPEIGSAIHQGEDYHSVFNEHGVALCCNHELNECRNLKGSIVQECTLGTNISDDLKYRCDDCFEERRKTEETPIWVSKKIQLEPKQKREGLLLGERKAKQLKLRKILIANAKRQWEQENPGIANELDQLHLEASERTTFKDGVLAPSWRGSNNWPRTRSRLSIMNKMKIDDPTSYEEYKANEEKLVSINREQAEFIKQELVKWEHKGSPTVSLDEGSSISSVSDMIIIQSSGEVTFSIHADSIKRASFNVVARNGI